MRGPLRELHQDDNVSMSFPCPKCGGNLYGTGIPKYTGEDEITQTAICIPCNDDVVYRETIKLSDPRYKGWAFRWPEE
jgi:hypothetical protein